MSTTPRVGSAVPGAPTHLGTARAHTPELTAAFDAMYAALLGRGTVSMDVKEAMRLRNAHVTGCGL
ncbi:MAG: hypothetical protein ACKO91_07585 [Acidimicrobiales bacterium]